jgi:hypothetical protein
MTTSSTSGRDIPLRSSEPELAVVARVQRRLQTLAWARALLLGVATGVACWLVVELLLHWIAPGMQWSAAVVGVIAAIGTAVFIRKRAGIISGSRAALWLEEQFPSLQFSLVTLHEFSNDRKRTLTSDAHDRLVSAIGRPVIAKPLSASARKQLLVPAAMALLLVASALPLHGRIMSASATDNDQFGAASRKNATASAASPEKALAAWRVRVIPPAYSALETQTLGDVGLVTALVGSTIEVTGVDASAPEGVVRSVSDSIKPLALVISHENAGWRTRLSMPEAAAEVRFVLGTAARQLLLEPRPDSLPVVELMLPLRDSVYRVPKGTVTLSANAHDDFGLASANFELIVTSGEGERFTAKTVAVAAQKLNGERDRKWQATMSLDTMKLEPGDIVHMRAVARDRNPEKGREPGASETRTFRIARPGDYDSVAVDPAPPPEMQKSLMSQRMLLIMTEKLEAQRPGLTRAALVSESRKLSAEQLRLRKTVGDIVFQRLEGEDGAGEQHKVGEDAASAAVAGSVTGGPPTTEDSGDDSPIIGVNKPLLEAFNAMWDAGSALDIADTKAAIPHMKLALAAIERARSAERIYLRGKPPVVVIDVAKVRLAGRDTGVVNTRSAREALSPKEALRESRLLAAALLMTRDASAARDSLAVLRLESLVDAPRLAAALGDALEVVRRGGNVTDALVRARRLLGNGAPADSLGRWRGMP